MKLFLLICAILFCNNFCIAQFKVPKEHFNMLFNSGNYRQAFLDAKEIREKEYGKCCLIDYYIAKAFCLDQQYDAAQKHFYFILDHYKLQGKNLQFILSKRDECNSKVSESVSEFNPANILVLNNLVIPMATVNGKLGRVANCDQHYTPVAVEDSITADELTSRVFGLDNKLAAMKKINSLLPSSYKVDSAGRFILVTMKNSKISPSNAINIANELSKVIDFYSSSFSIRPPDKLLTVYLLPDSNELVNTARIIHGIRIPYENYGYSCLGDLSLLGLSSLNSQQIGTLKHELFHLAIRTDIGDIPAWLDEGIACLYETSSWDGKQLLPDIHNWREDVLKNCFTSPILCAKMPTLSELVNYSWKEFDASDSGDICKAAINYALAKHLMIYFEQTGKLKDIVTAFKDSDVPQWNNESSTIRSNTQILENVLGKSMNIIESDFNSWLRSKYQFSFFPPSPPPPTKEFPKIKNFELIAPHFIYKKDYDEAEELIIKQRLKGDSSTIQLKIITEAERNISAIDSLYKSDIYFYHQQIKNTENPDELTIYTEKLFEKTMQYHAKLTDIINSLR